MHNKLEIPALTGLRFIAAFSIVYGHFTIPQSYTIFGVAWQTTIIGMPLFFALSGFIIHYVYAQLFSLGWWAAVREFAYARFSRLYPLFIFLFAYFFFFRWLVPFDPRLTTPHGWPTLLSYLTLTSSWWYQTIEGKSLIQFTYGWSWSVSTECFFYLMYAVVFYRVERIQSPRLCLKLLVGFCIFAYLLLYWVYSTQDSWETYILAHHHSYISRNQDWNNSFVRWFVYVSPYLQILEFIGGCLTCQFYLLIRNSHELKRKAQPGLLALVGIIWMLVCLLGMSEALPQGLQEYTSGFPHFLHMNFLLAPACFMLILACALGGNLLSKVLSYPLPVFLGTISYSIYLIYPVIPSVVPFGHPDRSLRLVYSFIMAVIVASGLYTVIEVPTKRWLRKLY